MLINCYLIVILLGILLIVCYKAPIRLHLIHIHEIYIYVHYDTLCIDFNLFTRCFNSPMRLCGASNWPWSPTAPGASACQQMLSAGARASHEVNSSV